jgi:hypothetical protein
MDKDFPEKVPIKSPSADSFAFEQDRLGACYNSFKAVLICCRKKTAVFRKTLGRSIPIGTDGMN